MSLFTSGLLNCGCAFITEEVKLHEGYLIRDLQWLLHAFPGFHCMIRKVCKSREPAHQAGSGG